MSIPHRAVLGMTNLRLLTNRGQRCLHEVKPPRKLEWCFFAVYK